MHNVLRTATIVIATCAMLLGSAYGQIDETSYEGQKPLEVEVLRQDDSPLKIAVTNIDNSGPSFQRVDLLIQNVGSKPVWGTFC